ncbi:hypothetical protein [Marinobacter sp. M2C]|uniref:hypothetical protein n=1 Tax=Marinobacter sp. M2C TaxID=2917714 RepID=UPI00200FAA8A|nr:hypothetical protein [Marinobacter sp. M2C]UQG64150.1 hypothetical protein MIH17_18400 [Marinobacter sp. M2C]
MQLTSWGVGADLWALTEQQCLEWFAEDGWEIVHGPDLAPDGPLTEPVDYRQVLLLADLEAAIRRIVSAGLKLTHPWRLSVGYKARWRGLQRTLSFLDGKSLEPQYAPSCRIIKKLVTERRSSPHPSALKKTATKNKVGNFRAANHVHRMNQG